MNLFEKVKNFLGPDKIDLVVPEEKILQAFETEEVYTTGAFFDDDFSSVFSARDKANELEAQKSKIMLYRNLSKQEEVHDAIDEIVNEVVYSETKDVLKVEINEENEKIQDAIQSAFNKILKIMNIKKNFYSMVRQSYIDGQIIVHCEYNKDLSLGIEKVKMIDPIYFYYDKKSEKYKYLNKDKGFLKNSNISKDLVFDKEEILRFTYSLTEGKINLSYLENAIKSANQLKTLEDLLIPLRFSRSISRRVFNVDTGELSNSKSLEAMREIQKKFKYKKFYDTDTGAITNQQHITSMVEDYWFANRSGGKGTTVDVIDETGNLGEVNDILYFQKKLYKALKIPQNRISGNPDADNSFDYDSTAVTHEDMKFFLFVQRIRQIYIDLLMELMRRELISTGIMNPEDFEIYKDKIEIRFANETLFLEKLKLANFEKKLDIYATAQEYAGKLFPVEKILKDIFRMDDEEIDEMFKAIAKEEKDKRYSKFYQEEDY